VPIECANLSRYDAVAREGAMKRREFIALAGASVAWPFAAMAQQTGRTYRLGFLAIVPRDALPNMAFF
jgi:hypothetical protein